MNTPAVTRSPMLLESDWYDTNRMYPGHGIHIYLFITSVCINLKAKYILEAQMKVVQWCVRPVSQISAPVSI